MRTVKFCGSISILHECTAVFICLEHSDWQLHLPKVGTDDQWSPPPCDIIWKWKFDTWTQFIYWSLVTANSCIMIRIHNKDFKSNACVRALIPDFDLSYSPYVPVMKIYQVRWPEKRRSVCVWRLSLVLSERCAVCARQHSRIYVSVKLFDVIIWSVSHQTSGPLCCAPGVVKVMVRLQGLNIDLRFELAWNFYNWKVFKEELFSTKSTSTWDGARPQFVHTHL